MASLPLDHLVDLVGLLKGEFPDCRLPAAEDALQSELGAMLEAGIEEAARSLTRAAPLSSLTIRSDFLHLIPAATLSPDGSYAELTLPSSFCRLTALRLPDWGMTLDEETIGDPLRSSLGESAPEWMRRRNGRPWLRIIRQAGRTVLRFGPADGSPAIEAAYVPLPSYDRDSHTLRDFDPSLTAKLAETMAKSII